jgi:malate dehydrogenase (oxaloacetate-decarboxylating)
MRGADVCVAFSASGPGVIKPEWVRMMARDAIVFACANPVPEIWPSDAIAAGARIVATGRSDFPNQLNDALVFPGLFRGVLDVRARTITDELASTVARALAGVAAGRGLREDRILPPLDDLETHVTVAVAAGMAAQVAGVARVAPSGTTSLRRRGGSCRARATRRAPSWRLRSSPMPPSRRRQHHNRLSSAAQGGATPRRGCGRPRRRRARRVRDRPARERR